MLVTEDYYYNFHFQKSVKKKNKHQMERAPKSRAKANL